MYLKVWERDREQAETGQQSTFEKQRQKVKSVTVKQPFTGRPSPACMHLAEGHSLNLLQLAEENLVARRHQKVTGEILGGRQLQLG